MSYLEWKGKCEEKTIDTFFEGLLQNSKLRKCWCRLKCLIRACKTILKRNARFHFSIIKFTLKNTFFTVKQSVQKCKKRSCKNQKMNYVMQNFFTKIKRNIFSLQGQCFRFKTASFDMKLDLILKWRKCS